MLTPTFLALSAQKDNRVKRVLWVRQVQLRQFLVHKVQLALLAHVVKMEQLAHKVQTQRYRVLWVQPAHKEKWDHKVQPVPIPQCQVQLAQLVHKDSKAFRANLVLKVMLVLRAHVASREKMVVTALTVLKEQLVQQANKVFLANEGHRVFKVFQELMELMELVR